MKRKLVHLLKLALTLALLALLYARVDLGSLSSRLASVRWEWLGAFWAILLANSALSALKWRVLLAADGIRQPFHTLLASYLIGSFFNMFLPSTIGGDAYRIADIGKRSARTANAAASVMVDRLSGFLALALYGLLLFPVFHAKYAPSPWLLLLPVAAFGALAGLAFALWDQSLLRGFTRRLPAGPRGKTEGILDALRGSMQAYGRRRDVLRTITAISFAFQFLAIVAVYCLGRALSLELPLVAFGFFVPFISLIEMLPITVFGLGTRDAAYVWFMESVGRTRADAAAICLLYVAATVLYVSLGGVLYAVRGARSLSAKDAASA